MWILSASESLLSRVGETLPAAVAAGIVFGAFMGGCAHLGQAGKDKAAALFVADMSDEHDFKPQGVGRANWGRHARVGYRKPPDGWSCAVMWGQIYPAEGGDPSVNARVQIRDLRLWYLSRRDDRWHELQASAGLEGAAYRQDFAGDENVPADMRKEMDGSVSVKMAPGRNFHFWPTGGRADLKPGDVAAMASSFRARLVLDDASKPDDLDSARLVGSCGGDFWRAPGVQWAADWSNNGDWAIGRFKLITREWKVFTATNAEPELLRKNPPPLRLE